MPEAHFELRLPDGNLKTRLDGTTMEFKPSAYMAIEYGNGQGLVFQRDQRVPAKLQFFGGGIEIGRETPRDAAIREPLEEGGVRVISSEFLGQFETYEPVHLFRAREWDLPQGVFVLQEAEVSEVVHISFRDIESGIFRSQMRSEFYNAQWKMLGWYMLWRVKPEEFPVFALWSEDPWVTLNSL